MTIEIAGPIDTEIPAGILTISRGTADTGVTGIRVAEVGAIEP